MTKKAGHQPGKIKEPSPVDIHSLAQLKGWLTSQNIDIARWGSGPTKTLESLWDELVNGEMSIQGNPPLRVTSVVRVIIRNGNRILIEAEQEFGDKRKRARNHPPSEKMRAGESYLEAAKRCLQEELGLASEDFEINDSMYRQIQQELESPSYPGLPTRYIFHIVEARVSGLPQTDFWTAEAGYNHQDPVKRHYWVWQTDET